METTPTLWEVAEMDVGIDERHHVMTEGRSDNNLGIDVIESEHGVGITKQQQQQQQQLQEEGHEKQNERTELNQHQSEIKSSLDILACRSDDISVDLLNFAARTQHDISADDKEYMCAIASNVRAHFQRTLECSRSLFQSNVRCFLHIIELQKHHEEYQRDKDAEMLRMQGRIDGLMDILEEKQKENQTLREGVELKGLWSKLLKPFSESPGDILSEYDHSYSPCMDNSGNLSFSTALTWLSAACAGRVLADPNHQNLQVTDYIAQLIPEIRRCHQVASENHEETERENKNLRNVLAKKSAMYSMAQERCANADLMIERIQMELEDAQAELLRCSERAGRYAEEITNLNENLDHAHKSRDAYRELSDRLGSRLKVSENLIRQYEYDLNKEFGVNDSAIGAEEEEASYESMFEDEEDVLTTTSCASATNEKDNQSGDHKTVPVSSVGAFDDLLIATSPRCTIHSTGHSSIENSSFRTSSDTKSGEVKNYRNDSGMKRRIDMKERKLSFTADSSVSSSPSLLPQSPQQPSSSSLSAAAATEAPRIAELELNTSVISINESLNNISMSSVPIRRVIKPHRRYRVDSLRHLTIPLGKDMDICRTPLSTKAKQYMPQEQQPTSPPVSTPNYNILDEQYKKELESELAYLKVKSPELHKEIATVLKDVISPQTVTFDFSPMQTSHVELDETCLGSNNATKENLYNKDVIGMEKLTSVKPFNTPRQVKSSALATMSIANSDTVSANQ